MSKLLTLLKSQVSESDSTATLVGQQRSRNHRYYSLQPLGNEQEGRSQYIDPAVFGAVEDKKAIFDETFLSSRQVVRFNGPNTLESEAKTAYVRRTLKANKYTRLFRDGWHDAFVAKRMTVWVDWRRRREKVTLNFLGAATQDVNQHLARLGTVVNVNRDNLQSNPVPSPMGQPQFVHTGTLVVELDQSYMALDLIQPDLVYRDPGQSYAEDAAWNTARIDTTRLDLINRGFDAEQVLSLSSTGHRRSDEDSARKQHDGSHKVKRGSGMSGMHDEVEVYWTRAWLAPEDMDVEGVEAREPAIYEVYWANDQVLRWDDGTPAVRVLDDMGVHEWGEYKIAHAEHSLCTADVEAHPQRAGSSLKRGILDNMYIANNPMWESNVGAYDDARDLYDGVIGGVLELSKGYAPGQTQPLVTAPLSPLVGVALQMIDQDSEERSGMATASRGLNPDVISQQNAESMVDKVMARGERRVAMAARSFANDFYIPLAQCVVRWAMKYDQSQSAMESGGRKIPIVPSQWQDHAHEMEVEVALTPTEAHDQSVKLLAMDARLSQDPKMGPLYQLKHKHALYDTAFELMGIKDSTKFMGSPEDPQTMQVMAQMQQQAAQQQQKQDQLLAMSVQFKAEENERSWAELQNKIMDTRFDNELAEDKFNMDTFFNREELALEKTQKRPVSV